MKVVYLAGAYSKGENKNLAFNFHLNIAKWLVKQGYAVYSPIVHSHFIASRETTSTPWWEELEPRIISVVDGVLFILDDNMFTSEGCKREFKYALANRKPIGFIVLQEANPTRIVWTIGGEEMKDDGGQRKESEV